VTFIRIILFLILSFKAREKAEKAALELEQELAQCKKEI